MILVQIMEKVKKGGDTLYQIFTIKRKVSSRESEMHFNGCTVLFQLTIEAALTLCEACDNLRILGELHTWKRVTSEDVELLSDYIKEHNWDVKISFRDIFYPLV